MKSILVTGANGQLAESIRFTAQNSSYPVDLSFIGVSGLDLTDREKVKSFFTNRNFDYIINCAAYTAVDLAEKNTAEAFAVNAEVPALLGQVAYEKNSRLIHISTDYVFDGLSPFPYDEKCEPHPLSVYGKSKFEGELALMGNPNALVIRSSWLYSEFGNNFLKTMMRLGSQKEKIGVVFDQTGSPTYAPDLAEAILNIITHHQENSFPSGTYHFANQGVASWYDLAWEIMDLAGISCRVYPITTNEFPLPAKRPAYSVLNTSRIRNELGISTDHWKASLKIAVDRMMKI